MLVVDCLTHNNQDLTHPVTLPRNDLVTMMIVDDHL